MGSVKVAVVRRINYSTKVMAKFLRVFCDCFVSFVIKDSQHRLGVLYGHYLVLADK